MTSPRIHPDRIKSAIAHWEREITATRSQIQSGAFPQFDDNCRRYIKECRRYIRNLRRQTKHHPLHLAA